MAAHSIVGILSAVRHSAGRLRGNGWDARSLRVDAVVRGSRVVNALQVEWGVWSEPSILIGGDDTLAIWVKLLHQGLHGKGIINPAVGVAENFIADGPDDNGRVVAITLDEVGDLVELAAAKKVNRGERSDRETEGKVADAVSVQLYSNHVRPHSTRHIYALAVVLIPTAHMGKRKER